MCHNVHPSSVKELTIIQIILSHLHPSPTIVIRCKGQAINYIEEIASREFLIISSLVHVPMNVTKVVISVKTALPFGVKI